MSDIRSRLGLPVPSAEVRARAAVWVAELHDEKHGSDWQTRLEAWLDESEEHRRAFRRMDRIWEQTALIGMRARADIPAVGRTRARLAVGAAVAATLILAVVIAVRYGGGNALVSGVGQQRFQSLPDGTRVVLNTDTRIEVNYDEHARRVRLIHGEAWFEVAHRPAWPFLVSANGEEIRALGTSFIVRHDDIQSLSVTLVEGQISVAPIVQNPETLASPQILHPGQRFSLSHHHFPAVDRPDMTRVTAWRRGQVEFEQTPLGEAVGEMNRYSTTHIVVADAAVAQLPIGGVFRAGDAAEFVRIVTAALDLRSDHRGEDVVLSRSASLSQSK